MTIISKSETFRNTENNCTILVQQYAEKPYFVKFWSYYYKYDYMDKFVQVSKQLSTKPSKARLAKMF